MHHIISVNHNFLSPYQTNTRYKISWLNLQQVIKKTNAKSKIPLSPYTQSWLSHTKKFVCLLFWVFFLVLYSLESRSVGVLFIFFDFSFQYIWFIVDKRKKKEKYEHRSWSCILHRWFSKYNFNIMAEVLRHINWKCAYLDPLLTNIVPSSATDWGVFFCGIFCSTMSHCFLCLVEKCMFNICWLVTQFSYILYTKVQKFKYLFYNHG